MNKKQKKVLIRIIAAVVLLIRSGICTCRRMASVCIIYASLSGYRL